MTLLVNFWSKLYSKSFTSDCTIERGPQIGAPFKLPSYLVHPLVVPSIRFRTLVSNAYELHRFASSLGDAPSLRSVTGGCSLASLSHWGMLPRFTQSLGACSLALLSRWGMLSCFAQSLGDAPLLRSVAGDAPSLRSVAGGCSLALLSRWGDAPSLRSVACHSMVQTIEKMSWYPSLKRTTV